MVTPSPLRHPGPSSGAPPLAVEIGTRVRSCAAESLGAATLSAARTAIIDTVAVTLLGSLEPSVRKLRATLGGTLAGPARVFGSDERASVLDAALLNGVASHALDFDDFTQEFGGHPSVPVLPGLLALAEARDASGRDLIAAYVAGVEAETRVAAAVHFHHYEKGWHPTSTLGVFGAAAACGHLIGLDAHGIATALAISTSLASGLKANFGTMTKPLHVGHCTRSGLHAALLAAEGFDASLDAFEHPHGFLEVYNGAGHYDVEAMLVPWFDPPVVESPGIGLKQFACCGSTHPAIYMALELRGRGAFAPGDVRTVDVRTHPRRLPHTDNPDPRSPLEAKFSMQYCVARALLDGEPRLAHFEGDAPFDPEVRRLMDRTRVSSDPEMARRSDRAFGAEVTVTLADGRRESARVEHMPGRGPAHPMTEQELRTKFLDCAERALEPDAAAALFAALLRLPELGSVRELDAAMRARPSR